jgi:hypothetical protein
LYFVVRPTRQTSASNLKRLLDNNEPPRKYPKLLAQALKDEIKIECQDHSIISSSTAIAATRPLNQVYSEIHVRWKIERYYLILYEQLKMIK